MNHIWFPDFARGISHHFIGWKIINIVIVINDQIIVFSGLFEDYRDIYQFGRFFIAVVGRVLGYRMINDYPSSADLKKIRFRAN